MPRRFCPQCERPGRLLEAASQNAWVIYYRCDACGHVWAHDKDDINSPRHDVTMRAAEKCVVGAVQR
jgi:uncharacterized Zn finger protein